jgi:Fe-S-cluster containining protein
MGKNNGSVTKMHALTQLHVDIDSRVNDIRQDNTDWLCGLGCDGCCHRLSDIPLLTLAEWNLLKEGLAALPLEQLQKIGQDMVAVAVQASRPIICPMLDHSAGACLVYEHRPIACRTYGFYVQRDKGLYCKDIELRVAKGEWAEVVWGNQDAIDHRLGSMGHTRDLTDWFAEWQNGI